MAESENTKYVKLYNEQGLPLGFKNYADVASALVDARVKLYDENTKLLGFRVGVGDTPRVAFSFTFPVSVTALNNQTITFADIADFTNLRLITTGDDELKFVDGVLTDSLDEYATTTIEGNVVTLHVSVPGGPQLISYAWAE